MNTTTLFEKVNNKRSEINIKDATGQLRYIYNTINEFEKAINNAEAVEQLNAILNDINGVRNNYKSYLKDNRIDVLFARCADPETAYFYDYINKSLEIYPDTL